MLCVCRVVCVWGAFVCMPLCYLHPSTYVQLYNMHRRRHKDANNTHASMRGLGFRV